MSASNDEFKPRAQLLDELDALRAELGRLRAERSLWEASRASQTKTLYSLQVHQEELRTQNDELVATSMALEESRETYRKLFDLAPVGYLSIGPRMTIQAANHQAAAMLGRQPEQLLEQPLWPYVIDEDRHKVAQLLRNLGPSGASSVELVLVSENRQLSVILTSVRSTSDPDAHYLTSLLDITALKQAERVRAELEQRLSEAQRLESLGILAGGVAHDFNNLLMAVTLSLDLALDNLRETDNVRRWLTRALDVIASAKDLTDQMLAYSGKGHFVVEDIDLNVLLRDMQGLLESSIPKKLALAFELGDELPGIRADRAQCRQIIMNLVINAADASGPEGGQVTIRTGLRSCGPEFFADLPVELAPGRYVSLEVNDDGAGVDETIAAKIFDPFFTTKATGRGLGLAAVHGIVRGHRGGIWMNSELGEGSTFTVLLPALDAPASVVDTEHRRAEAWRGAGTLLVVDDVDIVREVARDAVERLGFSVLEAADGLEAVDLFRANRDEIVCVLLDLSMPHMGGEETFQILRQLDPQVRVILSSGFPESESLGLFEDGELAGFVKKPYDLATLRQVLRAALTGSE